MIRCDFGCTYRATDAIRIGGNWHETCSAHADATEHSDRLPLTRSVRRRLRLR